MSDLGNGNSFEVIGGDLEMRIGPSAKNTISPSNSDDLTEGIGTVPPTYGKPGKARLGQSNLNLNVEANKTQTIRGEHSELVQKSKDSEIERNYLVKDGREFMLDAGDRIALNGGSSQIALMSNGTIDANGRTLSISMDKPARILADVVKIN